MGENNISSIIVEQDKAANTKQNLPSSILFLCTQNAVRSPMAAALLKKFTRNNIFIQSAGIATKDIDGFAVSVLKEVDIDISDHVSLSIENVAISSFDLVVCFSEMARNSAEEICRAVATELEFWPVYDPVNQTEKRTDQLEHYRKLRVQLDELLNKNFNIK